MTTSSIPSPHGESLPKVFLLKNKTVPLDPYHESFEEAQFDPVFLPLLQHEYVGHVELKDYLESQEFLYEASALIITSQRAIEAVNAHLPNLDSDALHELLHKPVYTVGPATAKALSEAGYVDIRGGKDAGNGAVLAEIILGDLSRNKLPPTTTGEEPSLIFFTGKTRRDIIPKRLTEAGKNLQERIVYQTSALNDIDVRVKQHLVKSLSSDHLANGYCIEAELQKQSQASHRHYLVFFSPAEADGVVETLIGMKEKNCYLAAIGPTTKDYLESKGLPPDVVAEKPDAAHLLRGIMNHQATL